MGICTCAPSTRPRSARALCRPRGTPPTLWSTSPCDRIRLGEKELQSDGVFEKLQVVFGIGIYWVTWLLDQNLWYLFLGMIDTLRWSISKVFWYLRVLILGHFKENLKGRGHLLVSQADTAHWVARGVTRWQIQNELQRTRLVMSFDTLLSYNTFISDEMLLNMIVMNEMTSISFIFYTK